MMSGRRILAVVALAWKTDARALGARVRHPMGLDVKPLLGGCAGSRHRPRRLGVEF